jgi:hypothetical protein
MATIASAKQKLEQKQRVMPQNYNERMGNFLGISPAAVANSPAGQAYSSAVNDPSMPDRWERNLRAAFS